MKKNKLALILSSILIIYSILGFVAIPKIVKPIIVDNINANITQEASLEKVEFNPFLLTFSLHNLKIQDKENITFSIDSLSIDFNLFRTISEKHLAFQDLQLINPYIHIIENEDKSFNLEKLLKPTTKEEKQESIEDEQSEPIKFQIYKTVLEKAKIKFTKLAKDKKPFEVNINELNYTFYDMGTFRNILASHSLNILINEHTKLMINGGLKVHPFHMYGNVKLTNLRPNEFLAYKDELFNFQLTNETNIDLNFGYKVDTKKELDIKVEKLNFKLSNLNILQDAHSVLYLKSLDIEDLNLFYPQNEIKINQFGLENLNGKIINSKEETINLTKLVNLPKEQEKKEVQQNSKQEETNWKILLANFKIANSKLSFKDEKNSFATLAEGVNLNAKNLKIVNQDISLEQVLFENKNFVFNDIKNNLDVKVKNSSLKVEDLKLNDKNRTIKQVALKSSININDKKQKKDISAQNLELKIKDIINQNSDIQIANLNLIEPDFKLNDKVSKTNIQAKDINLLVNKISHKNSELKIDSSNLNKPFIAITLGKQEKKKVEAKEVKKIEKKVEEKANSNFSFDIGPLIIKDARMVFEDKNLPIPFKTNITQLHGDFSRLNSSSSKPTKLELEGKVDKYGFTKITGTVDINDIKLLTDTTILFKNIAIKNFTPYSGKFVGREIDSGKLDLNLKYNIRESNLDANNSIIISDIRLGKTVQSEDATNLPLDLAIALLENSDGVIDLELPISGNVDDPQFAIAPIVWKVFTNLIVKAISSPFTLLASVLGIEADEIKTIDFEYGKSTIIASEKEALDNIAKILATKKRLAINVTPSYHQVFDTIALQDIKFDKFLEKRMKKILKGDEYKEALEDLFEETFKDKDLDDIKDSFVKKDKNGKEYFDTKEYVENLRKTLASKQEVTTKELEELANSRSKNILDYLIIGKKVDKKAVVIAEKINVQIDEKDKWSTFNLSVSVKK